MSNLSGNMANRRENRSQPLGHTSMITPQQSDIAGYKEAMSVNGQYEYETSWSLQKRLMSMPLLLWVYLETFLITLVVKIVFLVLPVSQRMKKDMRLWPASPLFYMASTGAMFAKRNSMKWQAIEYIYNWESRTTDLGWYDSLLTRFWGSFENVLATRNRFRILKREIFWEISRLIQEGKPVAVVSLAAGSARGPIEVMTYFLRRNPRLLDKFTIHLVDNDPEAYEFAQRLAAEMYPGLEKRIVYKQMTISSKKEGLLELFKLLEDASPDITEMVGFHDYMGLEKALKVNGTIFQAIPRNSLFITNNVAPNIERRFLELVVSWKMVNRTEQEVLNIMHDAGFTMVKTIWEATAIQTVYSCRK